MLGVAVVQIIARNVFETGLLWGDDLVRMAVLWLTMVGGVIAAGEGKHISIDVFKRLATPAVQRWVHPIVCIATSAICFALAYVSIDFVWWDYVDGTIGVGAIPAWLFEAIIPVCAFLMGTRYLVRAFGDPE